MAVGDSHGLAGLRFGFEQQAEASQQDHVAGTQNPRRLDSLTVDQGAVTTPTVAKSPFAAATLELRVIP
jgi:hypothetical protein